MHQETWSPMVEPALGSAEQLSFTTTGDTTNPFLLWFASQLRATLEQLGHSHRAGAEPGEAELPVRLVLNLCDIDRPRSVHRRGQGTFVATIVQGTDDERAVMKAAYPALVRSLSNMRLADMLEPRHSMSRAVRAEVSPHAAEWGYSLGSVYIRKVHFRDAEMMRQIESKIVNRLRQVTGAIQQDGANQVNIIRSTAEREAAVEFARAATQRPQIVGAALERAVEDPATAEALFEILETQRLLDANAEITLLPSGAGESALTALLAAQHGNKSSGG